MIYSSDRKFKIWAYTVSHSSLLLRSELKYFDEDGYAESRSYNIDIEFWAVEYLDIPHSFDGILIDEITKSTISEKLMLHVKKSRIFEIATNQMKYYIIAGGFIIGKNRWEKEDRIFNHNLKLNHDEIIAVV